MIVELHDFLTEANVEIGYQVVFILETGEYFSRDNPVSDSAYGPAWNGDTSHSPSKNSVFDKIESLVTPNHDHSGDAGDGGTFDAANLTSGASTDGRVLTSDGSGGAAWGSIPSQVEDAAYGSGWNGDTTHAPSQDAVYDKINAMISDTAYGAGWDGVTDVAPSKNAVYDKIQTLSSGSTDVLQVQVFS